MAIRVKDLDNLTGSIGVRRPFLYCPACGEKFSANAGNYGDWNGHPPEHVFRHCRRMMILATERRVIERVEVAL